MSFTTKPHRKMAVTLREDVLGGVEILVDGVCIVRLSSKDNNVLADYAHTTLSITPGACLKVKEIYISESVIFDRIPMTLGQHVKAEKLTSILNSLELDRIDERTK